MKIGKIIKSFLGLFKRKWFVRYTFFDANNMPHLFFEYLFVFFKDWKKAYEEKMTSYFGAPAFSAGSGRMAMYLLLKLFDVGKGDEVILTGYTCVVCPNAVIYTGAVPVYVDIDPETYGIDPGKLEGKINRKTKAVVVQHTYGIPADIERILEIARKHSLIVIEDCAHSLGIRYKGKLLGTFGDAAFFSSDHTKMISTSIGGGIVLNNIKYSKVLEKIIEEEGEVSFIQKTKIMLQYLLGSLLSRPYFNWFGWYLIEIYHHRLKMTFYFNDENVQDKSSIKNYPYPAMMTNFQCFLGYKEFCSLDENIKHRSEIVKKMGEIFGCGYGDMPLLMFPLLVADPSGWKNIFSQYIEIFDWFSIPAYGKKGGHEGGLLHGGGMSGCRKRRQACDKFSDKHYG